MQLWVAHLKHAEVSFYQGWLILGINVAWRNTRVTDCNSFACLCVSIRRFAFDWAQSCITSCLRFATYITRAMTHREREYVTRVAGSTHAAIFSVTFSRSAPFRTAATAIIRDLSIRNRLYSYVRVIHALSLFSVYAHIKARARRPRIYNINLAPMSPTVTATICVFAVLYFLAVSYFWNPTRRLSTAVNIISYLPLHQTDRFVRQIYARQFQVRVRNGESSKRFRIRYHSEHFQRGPNYVWMWNLRIWCLPRIDSASGERSRLCYSWLPRNLMCRKLNKSRRMTEDVPHFR